MQLLPDPPTKAGAIAQLGERLLCKQEVDGSIPFTSTRADGTRCRRSARSGTEFAGLKSGAIFYRVKREFESDAVAKAAA